MLEDIFERAWCCLNRITPSLEKKPPDKSLTTHKNNMTQSLSTNFKSKLNATLANGPSTNFRSLRTLSEEMSSNVDSQYLEVAFQELLVRDKIIFFFKLKSSLCSSVTKNKKFFARDLLK